MPNAAKRMVTRRSFAIESASTASSVRTRASGWPGSIFHTSAWTALTSAGSGRSVRTTAVLKLEGNCRKCQYTVGSGGAARLAGRTSPTTPTTTPPRGSPQSFIVTRCPRAAFPGHAARAKASLTITTRGALGPSLDPNVRPSRSGMPSASK